MKLSIAIILSSVAVAPLFAQVRWSVSTDTTTYQYGDSIHVSIEVVNMSDSAYTLGLGYCDATYLVDGVNVKAHTPCPLVIINYAIQPHDSLDLGPSFLPPFPVTDTLNQGSHIILGEVNGYLIPDTVHINIITHAEAEADEYFPLGDGDYWQYVVNSSNFEPPFQRDSSAYSLQVVGDTTMPNGLNYRTILYKALYPSRDSLYIFERVNPMTGNVFRYDSAWPSRERQIDSLLAQLGDTCLSSPDAPIPYPITFGKYNSICVGLMNNTLLGLATTVKDFMGNSVFDFSSSLALGLGLYNFTYAYDFGVTDITLVYARISGVEYGTKITLGVRSNPAVPESFALYQNYPNPFNPTTNIEYRIADFGFVSLKVYDVLGREVATLVNEVKKPGSHEVQFNGSGLASGVYFYQMTTPSYSKVLKMLLLK